MFQAPIWIKPNSLSHFLVGSVSVGEKGEKLVRRNVNLLENLHCYSFFLCCTIHFIKCYTSHIVGIEVGCSVKYLSRGFLKKINLLNLMNCLKKLEVRNIITLPSLEATRAYRQDEKFIIIYLGVAKIRLRNNKILDKSCAPEKSS